MERLMMFLLFSVPVGLMAPPWVPESWWEKIDPSVVVECRSGHNSVVIGFSPWLGRIRYDGGDVRGTVTSGSINFYFTNVLEQKCEWTVSRVSGEASLSCTAKAGTPGRPAQRYACSRAVETVF